MGTVVARVANGATLDADLTHSFIAEVDPKSDSVITLDVTTSNKRFPRVDINSDPEEMNVMRVTSIAVHILKQPMERNKIQLIFSPFWLKVGPCPLECDKKYLMHAIGSTFGGVIRAEVKGDFCRIKVNLNIQKQLRRGDCSKTEEDYPFSITLKAESSIVGKESLLFGSLMKKSMQQCFYTGEEVANTAAVLSSGATSLTRQSKKEVLPKQDSMPPKMEKFQERSRDKDERNSLMISPKKGERAPRDNDEEI
ncbi:hypothetical protein PVK06_032746 [Gossypium arboreum]|uniref:Uncharacterized protein n=1 Tax=Gossypium arboreum TaxID=29729 RepID=A0ABR0NUP4_GOSAR|nr:hypothetical protein PVK06_032746 [Gossypium arboreum]